MNKELDANTKAAKLLVERAELYAELAELNKKLNSVLVQGVSPGTIAGLADMTPDAVSAAITRARREVGIALRPVRKG